MSESTTHPTIEFTETDQAIERAVEDRFLLNNLSGQLSVVLDTGINLPLEEALSVTLQKLKRDRLRSAAADSFNYLCSGDSPKPRIREIASDAGIDFVKNRVQDGSRVQPVVTALHLEDYADQLSHSQICRTKAGGLGLLIDSLVLAQVRNMTQEESSYTNNVLHQLQARRAGARSKLVVKGLALGTAAYVIKRRIGRDK